MGLFWRPKCRRRWRLVKIKARHKKKAVKEDGGQSPDFVRQSQGKYTVTALNYVHVFLTLRWIGSIINVSVSFVNNIRVVMGSTFSTTSQVTRLPPDVIFRFHFAMTVSISSSSVGGPFPSLLICVWLGNLNFKLNNRKTIDDIWKK